MPNFKYKGRDKSGQKIEGFVEAVSQNHVVSKLANVDVVVISVELSKDEFSFEDLFRKMLRIGRPKIEDLIIFNQQMATLIKSGVPLIRSLQVICETAKNEILRNTLLDVVLRLRTGQPLSFALGNHPSIFSPLMLAMVEVGESTGNLEKSFSQMTIYLESELETHRRIKTSLRYPTIVILAIIVAIGIINIIVIPSFRDFFSAFGATLPWPTLLLIGFSDILMHDGWIVLFFVLLGIVGGFQFINSTFGKYWWSAFQLKIPLIGSILQRTMIARFCRAFSMTLSGNVPLLQSFKVIAKVVNNSSISNKILMMRDRLENGETIYHAAKNSTLFMPMVLQMIIIGEETGKMDHVFLEVAKYYEKEIDYDLNKLGDAIEPILIIIVAAMVLLLALGVFLPMWDISTVAFDKIDNR